MTVLIETAVRVLAVIVIVVIVMVVIVTVVIVTVVIVTVVIGTKLQTGGQGAYPPYTGASWRP